MTKVKKETAKLARRARTKPQKELPTLDPGPELPESPATEDCTLEVMESAIEDDSPSDDTEEIQSEEPKLEQKLSDAEKLLLNIDEIRRRSKKYKHERAQTDRGIGNQKPFADTFFRVHPDREFSLEDVPGLRIRGDRKKSVYLFADNVKSLVEDDIRFFDLYFCTTVDGDSFYWAVLSENNGTRELDSWSRSAHHAAEQARAKWVRLVPKETSYAAKVAEGDLKEPEWPDLTPQEVFSKAFRDHLITDPNHHAVKKLRGILV